MEATPLLWIWWLAENGLVHFLAFDFLLAAAPAGSRRRLPLWLAANEIAAWAVILLRPPAPFLLSALLLVLMGRAVLKIPGPELMGPVAVILALYTLKEGFSAALLSWLSVSFQSPTGGAAEQLLIPLLLDALLFAALRTIRGWYSVLQRPPALPGLRFLLPPCLWIVLSVRCGLRLDWPGFGPYLSALGLGARLSALCSMAGAALIVLTVSGAFCRLARLSGQETLLQGQLDAQRKRDARRAAFQHDIHNHLLVLSGLLREKSFAQAERYANRLQADSGRLLGGASTGNLALDVLLGEKLEPARRSRIAVTCSVAIPDGFGVEDADLCALFANLLDNAVTACRAGPPEGRFLTLSTQARPQLLVVEVVNSAGDSGPIVYGTGLENVRRIAETYQGAMEAERSAGRFRVRVLLCAR